MLVSVRSSMNQPGRTTELEEVHALARIERFVPELMFGTASRVKFEKDHDVAPELENPPIP